MAQKNKGGSLKPPIFLKNQQTGKLHEFGHDHAINLLTSQEAKGFKSWALPEDAKYSFKNGSLITRTSPPVGGSTKEQIGNRESAEARAEDTDAHGADNGQE